MRFEDEPLLAEDLRVEAIELGLGHASLAQPMGAISYFRAEHEGVSLAMRGAGLLPSAWKAPPQRPPAPAPTLARLGRAP